MPQSRKGKGLQPPIYPTPSQEPIIGMGRDSGNNLVQKSGPLYSLQRAHFTLQEYQIMDLYLSRINSHDPTHCTVHIDLIDLAKCLRVKELRIEDLKKHLEKLGTMVELEDPYNPNGFTMISLFTRAVCQPDEYGVWGIDLTCHPDARKYIFNVEPIGYFRYKLRSVLSMHSIYSYRLFMYLEWSRHQHPDLTWEIDVDDLRALFGLADDAYPGFKVFNDRLLKLVYSDLNNNTDCKYSYTTIKRGKYVKSVRFQLEPLALSESVQLPGQIVIADATHVTSTPQSLAAEDRWEGLTREQVQALRTIAGPLGDNPTAIDNVIRQHIELAKSYKARNLFSYVRKSISDASKKAEKSAKEQDARQQEIIQRVKEDQERTMRILKELDDKYGDLNL